jgi:hypothetical protein
LGKAVEAGAAPVAAPPALDGGGMAVKVGLRQDRWFEQSGRLVSQSGQVARQAGQGQGRVGKGQGRAQATGGSELMWWFSVVLPLCFKAARGGARSLFCQLLIVVGSGCRA